MERVYKFLKNAGIGSNTNSGSILLKDKGRHMESHHAVYLFFTLQYRWKW